ncbi:hypothetical protein [Echinicola rosea]|nr:hypothetical protein [Echinicola rosea]
MSLKNRQYVIPRPVKEALGEEDIDKKVLQNMLFIERQGGGYDILIARYYPAKEADVKAFDEINYGMLADGWSGTVDVYGYGEEHANGFKIEDGKVLQKSEYQIIKDNANESESSWSSCTGYWIDYPYQSQLYYDRGVLYGGLATGPQSTYVQSCWFPATAPAPGPPPNGGGTSGQTPSYDNISQIEDQLKNPCMNSFHDICFPQPGERYELDNKLTDPCAFGLFNYLKNNLPQLPSVPDEADDFAQAILDLFEYSNKFKYTITNKDVEGNSTSFAVKNKDTGKYEITTTLSDNYLERATKLSIVRTMIHESIHAYLSYEQYTNTFEDPFAAIRQYGMNHGITDSDVLHHEFMPAYIHAVATSLSRWDSSEGGGGLSWDYFEAMAWGGLTHHGKDGPMTEAFKANFPNSWERNKILEILENEATGNRKAKGDKCN